MTAADFQPFIDWLSANPNWVLISIFAISLVESLAIAGIIVPGVILIYLVATLSGHLGIPLWSVLSCGFFGALIGDGISFYIGYHYKESLLQLWPFSRYPKTLKLGEEFFIKHGGKSIMLGRFIGPIRPVLPLVAGMLGMSQLRFTLFNALSALAWAPFYILPGYVAGSIYQQTLPENSLTLFLAFLISIALLFIVIRYVSLKLHNIEAASSRAPLLIFILSSLLFLTWSTLSLNSNLFSLLDAFLFEFSQQLRGEIIDPILIHLTLLGDEGFLYISFTLFAVFMMILKRYKTAFEVVVAGLSTAVITHSLKFYFAIPRPELVLNPPESFAFPSGHSSGSTVFYTVVSIFIAQQLPDKNKWMSYAAFLIPVILISLSRVLLGVHWFTDIIGGMLLGLCIVSLTRLIFSHKDQTISSENIRAIGVFCITWGAACVAYQAFFFVHRLKEFQLAG